MRSNKFRLSALMLTVLLGACATPVSTAIKPTEANIAKYSELSALDVVTAFEKNVNDAKTANMDFLAPNYYSEASKVLAESQNGLSSKPKEQLAQLAAKGDAILEKGRSVMSIVQYRFTKELELKAQLDHLNAAKTLPKDYEKVMKDFTSLIVKVERELPENLDKPKEILVDALQKLEVRAVQEGALHESEAINAASKNKLADKQVPATYSEAVRIYQDAHTQIAAAPHDQELVVRLSKQALFAARHAQQLNDRVIELQTQLKGGSSSASPAMGMSIGGAAGAASLNTQSNSSAGVEKGAMEKVVLQEEDRLASIATALGQKDLRDLSFDKQAIEIKRAAADAAVKAKNEDGLAATKSMEVRLQAAKDATQKALAQVADQDQMLAAQTAQLAEKDALITQLNDKITALTPKKKVKAKR